MPGEAARSRERRRPNPFIVPTVRRPSNGVRYAALALALGAAAGALSACAPSLPVWGGGTSTPRGRFDVAAGASVRRPLGKLASTTGATVPSRVAQGGVSPAVQFRHGVGEHLDFGVTVSGTLARLDVRREILLAHEGTTTYSLLPSAGVYGGAFEDRAEGRGAWFGVDLPLLFGASFGTLIELYVGPRFGFEHAKGAWFENESTASGLGLRAGGTLGIGAGFMGHLGMLELTAQHEWWSGEVGGAQTRVRGFVLIPSFAFRIRL